MAQQQNWGVDPNAARQHYEGREITLYGAQAVAFDGTTSYHKDYPRHPLEARPPAAGNQYNPNTAAFDGTTTYGSQYVNQGMPDRHQHQARPYEPSGARFDGTSTYNSNYTQHPIERQQPHRPGGEQRPHVPFDGSTTYGANYVPHAHEPRRGNQGPGYQPNNVPFDGSTTYGANYVPHQHEARPPPAQHGGPRESIPFDGTTTYGDQFRPMPIMPRSAMKPGQYQPSGAKFEGESESADKYRAWAIDAASRCGNRPPPPMRPALPFDGTTTHREVFKGWQLPGKRPALGVQMVGDRAYVLIPANANLPAMGRQTFTTVHDNQTDISLLILEGDFTQASRCSVLGQFDMTGLPYGPKGSAKIEVTYHVDNNGVLSVSALDLDSKRHEQWLRQGDMVARVQ